MTNNFYYAAYSYLDEWMDKDQTFHKVLSFEKGAEISDTVGIRCLLEMATYYKVIRTLKSIEENSRLERAYKALCDTNPPRRETVVETVEAFARQLGKTYGSNPLSAASKFLWMRFRSPVVIYDSVASTWLSKNCGYKYDGYSNYYSIWLAEYRGHKEALKQACAELSSIKKFTRACDIADETFREWISSEWFLERVFDHFMLNDTDSNSDAVRKSAEN